MKKTIVINLFGGSGSGKSTMAAFIFAYLKIQRYHCELVHEYVKSWAWEERKVGKYDQSYIFGKQAKRESILYEKVDIIVTDSPLLLVPFFEKKFTGKEYIAQSVFNFIDFAKQNGVEYHNFFIERPKQYDPRGRYETEEEAKENDRLLKEFLKSKGETWIDISNEHSEERIKKVFSSIGIDWKI